MTWWPAACSNLRARLLSTPPLSNSATLRGARSGSHLHEPDLSDPPQKIMGPAPDTSVASIVSHQHWRAETVPAQGQICSSPKVWDGTLWMVTQALCFV